MINVEDIERKQTQPVEIQEGYQNLLYTVSHDLAAPIRSVMAFARLLDQSVADKLTEKERHYLNYVISNAEKVQRMFAGLLDYSRLVTRACEHVMTDTNQTVRESLVLMSDQIERANAFVQVDKLPIVRAESGQLLLLFSVLIDNALKFRRKDIVPHISITGSRNERGWVFVVKDNGIGIEQHYTGDIFQVFRRLHPEQEYPGIGMGLALAKRIVELHGGDIWVKSTPKKGSSFYFFLPDRES